MYTVDYYYNFIQHQLRNNSKKTFEIERADRLAATILSILSNMSLCARFFNELNERIAVKNTAEIDLVIPKTYKILHAIALPDPLAEDKNGHLVTRLEEVLLENEKKHGINKKCTIDTIPEFISQVAPDLADQIVMQDGLWNDYNGDPTGFVHGKYSHRIQYYIISRAFDEGLVDTRLLRSYLDPSEPGALVKYLLPTITQNLFFLFPIDAFSQQRRSHWHIAMENDPFKEHNNLPCLPAVDDAIVGNLASPTKIHEYLLSVDSFKDRSFLAYAIYSSTFSTLRLIAEHQKESIQKTFIQFVVLHINFKLSPELADAINAIMNSQANGAGQSDASGSFCIRNPTCKPPSTQHAEHTYAKATQLFQEGRFGEAAKKLHKAGVEYELLGGHSPAATSFYSEGSAYKRLGNYPKAIELYSQAYQRRLSLFGDINEQTQKAKTAMAEVEALHGIKQLSPVA
jgi:tetratricopeptide (TPR) repeat protein